MSNKSAATNFARSQRRQDAEGHGGQYNTERYYRSNRSLGDHRDAPDRDYDDEDLYDELNSGKMENYNSRGYYGSNYGSTAELNRGRNYEHNAGYRDSYEHLTTGQWPEIERAAQSRGFNLREFELAQRGVHRGKGPKGWQRADQRILEDINDLLTEDPYVDASEIEVQVEKGEVILSGAVENRGIKRRVEDQVEKVSGVRHVENRLRSKFNGGRSVNIQNSEK